MSYQVFYALANASFILNLILISIITGLIWRNLDYTMKSKAAQKRRVEKKMQARKDQVW